MPIDTIKFCLENFQELASGRLPIKIMGNSGPRANDGIGSSRLYLIMLTDAIKQLPIEQRNVVVLRYVKEHSLRDTLRLLKVNKTEYYKLCDMAISNIFRRVNGMDFS